MTEIMKLKLQANCHFINIGFEMNFVKMLFYEMSCVFIYPRALAREYKTSFVMHRMN